jgi:hypothetical protein
MFETGTVDKMSRNSPTNLHFYAAATRIRAPHCRLDDGLVAEPIGARNGARGVVLAELAMSAAPTCGRPGYLLLDQQRQLTSPEKEKGFRVGVLIATLSDVAESFPECSWPAPWGRSFLHRGPFSGHPSLAIP